MLRVYLDSNIFISFVRREIDKSFKLLFQNVEDFLAQCPERYILVLSDHALKEIKAIVGYKQEYVFELLQKMEIKIEEVKKTKADSEKAIEFIREGMHYGDALHAAIAINFKCDVLLTFNKKDFEAVKNLIKIKEPFELID